jgi:hypothetical protein
VHEEAACFADDSAKFKLYGLKWGIDPLATDRLQTGAWSQHHQLAPLWRRFFLVASELRVLQCVDGVPSSHLSLASPAA